MEYEDLLRQLQEQIIDELKTFDVLIRLYPVVYNGKDKVLVSTLKTMRQDFEMMSNIIKNELYLKNRGK